MTLVGWPTRESPCREGMGLPGSGDWRRPSPAGLEEACQRLMWGTWPETAPAPGAADSRQGHRTPTGCHEELNSGDNSALVGDPESRKEHTPAETVTTAWGMLSRGQSGLLVLDTRR